MFSYDQVLGKDDKDKYHVFCKEYSTATVEILLHFIYHRNSTYNPIPEIVTEAIYLASMFNQENMMTQCIKVLTAELKPENVFVAIDLSQELVLPTLFDNCIKFILEKIKRVDRMKKWHAFKKSISLLDKILFTAHKQYEAIHKEWEKECQREEKFKEAKKLRSLGQEENSPLR